MNIHQTGFALFLTKLVCLWTLQAIVFSSCGRQHETSLLSFDENVDFVQGRVEPETRFDEGAGPWNSKEPNARMKSRRNLALTFCKSGAAEFYGPDAAKTLQHYLENSGATYSLDVKRMIDETKSVKQAFEADIDRVKKFMMTASPGSYQLSSRQSQVGVIPNEDNRNWYLAVAGYQSWSYVDIVVAVDNNGYRSSKGSIEFYVRDRYNWDKGTSFNLGPITVTGEEMGEYHLMGLAQEFTSEGSYQARIEI